MTFQLLIVDDEATMRKGIANFMNWESIDCNVAGTASDGQEAIEFLNSHPVDIVITDIKMPVADGLEVAKYIYEQELPCRVILLTGYADFAYAQTAIRYNVSSFLLKPTNKKALFEAVQEAQKSIIASRRQLSLAQEELAFLKDQLFLELTDQPFKPELEERLQKLGISLDRYCVAAFQFLPAAQDIRDLKNIIIAAEKNAWCCRYGNLMITVYFPSKNGELKLSEILDNCREIIRVAHTLSSRTVAAGLSQKHESAAEFGPAVSEAIQALTLHFYSEDNLVLFSGKKGDSSETLTAENSMDLFQFESALNDWQFDRAGALLDTIFLKFKRSFVNSFDAKNVCSQIYYICSRVLMKRKSTAPDPGFLADIGKASDIFSLETSVRDLLEQTKELLSNAPETQNKLVEHTTRYIKEHLSQPLSLEIIAGELHISPSHLSRTFKKICGDSLTEYINKTRIAKAQELLRSSDSLTYEVAEMVGYHDPTYFSSIFRRYTGTSPSEYRQGSDAHAGAFES